jgi:hypothetical protein
MRLLERARGPCLVSLLVHVCTCLHEKSAYVTVGGLLRRRRIRLRDHIHHRLQVRQRLEDQLNRVVEDRGIRSEPRYRKLIDIALACTC